jgi:D-amino peptidase
MEIDVSADIAGVTGATVPEETAQTNALCGELRQHMTAEVAAACQDAVNVGACEVSVRDGRGWGRNPLPSTLPNPVPQKRACRGWSGGDSMAGRTAHPGMQ